MGLNNLKVEVEEIKRGASVITMFRGVNFPDVSAALEYYLKDYPRAGYSTHEMERGFGDDGRVFIKVWRLESCD